MRAVIAGLLTGVTALSATFAWELGTISPSEQPAAPRRPTADATISTANIPDRTPEWVATILARPLFSPDRRPAAETVAAQGARLPEGLPRLSGVIVSPFGRSAIFASDGRKPLVVHEGGRLDAWMVQAIDIGAVKISGPAGVRTLHPTFQNPSLPADRPPVQQRVGLSLER